MADIVYPLEQVLHIKKKRVQEAELVVREKQRLLDIELEKLAEREKERDKAKKHYQDKLEQLRAEMDHDTTSTKIRSMKDYLKVAQEKIIAEEKKVAEQKKQVKIAENNLEAAKEQLRLRRNEVDKMEIHKKDWMKEARKELEVVEQREMDEIGSVMFLTRKRQSNKAG